MDEQYKIKLGVEVDVDDIQSQINKADVKPVQIKVEIENLDDIKRQLQNLSGTKGKTKIDIPINTASIEGALKDVSSSIKEIKNAMGTLDSKSGMKSLLSSINQIASALDKASDKFEELNANLNALSGKDLSLNFGINLGGSNSVARQGIYGSHVRSETLPELKKQAKALQDYFKEYYNVQDELSAIMKLAPNRGGDIIDLYSPMSGYKSKTEKESLSNQMGAYREYINIIKEAASLRGIDISHITSGFSKSADQLIQDAQDIQTGAKEMDESFERLKQIFGGGNTVNIEGISQQLDSIVKDLSEIKTALQGLTSGVSLEGLTQSFDKLSDTIEKLVQNAVQVKNVLGDGLNTTVSDNSTEKAIQDQKELAQASTQTANAVVQGEERKQQAIKQTANAYDSVPKNKSSDIGQFDDDTTDTKELNAELKKLRDLAHQIGQLNFKIVKADYNDEINQIKEFERQLELLKTQYNVTLNSLNSKDVDIGSGITKEFADARAKIAEFEAKVKDTKAELAQNIKSNIGTAITRDIDKAHADFNKLSNKTEELHAKLKLLDSIKIDLDEAAAVNDIERLIDANTRYQKVLKDVQTQIGVSQRAEQVAFDKDAFAFDKEKAMLRLKSLFGENSEAAKRFASELDRIQRELRECADPKGLKLINKDIDVLGRKVKESGAQVQTFGQKLKHQFQQYSSYISVASLFSYASQGLRSMFEQVKLIDSAMTELKKVTNETDASYNKFLKNAASRSKELGTTIDGLVSSTADFARLGYGFEDAQGLAEVANIYAVVGDEIEGVEGATESLISTMAAFKGEMNGMSNTDFAMSIIDKFNEIGNNFSISSGGIGEALERSASSLMAANNTIDESIALITAANSVVQDPTAVGKVMPTLKVAISVKLLRRTRPRKDFII